MKINTMRRTASLVGFCVAMALPAGSAYARVVGFDVTAKTPAYDGRAFGDAGPYERIEGVAHFAVDPASEHLKGIVDLDKAPTNADGEVEFSTQVVILRPTGEASGTLVYEVPNRGRNLSFLMLNLSGGSSAFSVDDPGDGFLMDRGHTLVWSGWQADLSDPAIHLTLPVLEGVTGPSREEFIFDKDEAVSQGKLTYPAVDPDPAKATLTVRATPEAPRETPADLSFRFVDPTTIEITRPAGYDAGAIYELVYEAKDTVPSGLAFAATSDVISFLRGSPGHDAQSPVDGIDHTIAIGISQSGRFLRDLIYQGFNADENGARVFDGAMPHIAGSRKTFTNYRFAQPGRYSRQHEDHDFPGDQFPFSYAETTDPLTGRTDSVFAQCNATDTCPKLIHTDTSTEFWQARASLVSTAPSGEPLTMPDGVRLFFLAGAPHFNGWGGAPGDAATCLYQSNPVSAAPTMRALFVAMDGWVRGETTPPDSVYPGLADDGTLVDPTAIALPKIADKVPGPSPNALKVRDHSVVPPKSDAAYTVRVPKVDGDGIPLGGVRQPYIAAPLGTYLGWNLRDAGFAEGDLCGLTGSFIAFPQSASPSDSRKPLAERYDSAEAYLSALKGAASSLTEAGLMLPEDVGFVLEDAPKFPAGQ